jgi:hypothetical protein
LKTLSIDPRNIRMHDGAYSERKDFVTCKQMAERIESAEAQASAWGEWSNIQAVFQRVRPAARLRALLIAAMTASTLTSSLSRHVAMAASASEINRNVTQALTTLYETTPGAKALADQSKGVLVFQRIVKGGFIIAGHYGDGALRKRRKTVGYYRSIAASVGLQVRRTVFRRCTVLHG